MTRCKKWLGSSWQCSLELGHEGDHCFNGKRQAWEDRYLTEQSFSLPCTPSATRTLVKAAISAIARGSIRLVGFTSGKEAGDDYTNAVLAALREWDERSSTGAFEEAYRTALEEIRDLKAEPIVETGFAVGPLSLFNAAQRIAKDCLKAVRAAARALPPTTGAPTDEWAMNGIDFDACEKLYAGSITCSDDLPLEQRPQTKAGKRMFRYLYNVMRGERSTQRERGAWDDDAKYRFAVAALQSCPKIGSMDTAYKVVASILAVQDPETDTKKSIKKEKYDPNGIGANPSAIEEPRK